MKFLIILSLAFIFNSILSAQAEYVETSNPVYYFLERMENKDILPDYNSFEIPKTRNEIGGFLSRIRQNSNLLTNIDLNILKDLETEFSVELEEAGLNTRLIDNNGYNFFSDEQKYLYYTIEDNFNLFINLYAEYQYIHEYKKNLFSNNASAGIVGGIIRGSINKNFGFYLKGTNGNIFGNRQAALSRRIYAQNFKFTEREDETFFDYTEGYLTADYDLVKFKFGRDRIILGYGNLTLIDDNSPVFDYLGLNIKHKIFSYSFLHAKLIDVNFSFIPNYSDKYFVYHRLGFNINRHLDFGAGEIIIYGNRGIDLSYLNPFVFYKTVEHSNRDRDNSMLFFDINNNTIQGTKLFFMLLIDDISYGKIGTGWYGNQVMLNTGLITSDIFNYPVDLSFNYRRTEPYTFTHRFDHNNFTNLEYSLGINSIPNSDILNAGIKYRFNNRLDISSSISYIRHGKNFVSGDNIINYGGDINLGHREYDQESAKFLDGVRAYYRIVNFKISYEPFNQTVIDLHLDFMNNSDPEQSHREIQSFLTLKTIL